jgi:hypothetical protein
VNRKSEIISYLRKIYDKYIIYEKAIRQTLSPEETDII